MTSYAKRIRDLSPPAGVLAAYDRASVAHGFRQGRDKAAEIAAQADADIQALRDALKWYRTKVEGCNKHGQDGNECRDSLAKDRGGIARAALQAKGDE